MAQQQGTVYHQLTLFGEPDGEAVRHDPAWNGATGAQALSTCLQSQWDTRPNGNLFLDMISTRWTHVACGFYRTGDGHWWVVQNFR